MVLPVTNDEKRDQLFFELNKKYFKLIKYISFKRYGISEDDVQDNIANTAFILYLDSGDTFHSLDMFKENFVAT
jgi:hypothetical protein